VVTPARASGGCIFLLSSGQDPESAYLIDASASGSDVFLVSRAQLVPQDRGDDDVLYDARVGGVQPPTEGACEGTSCQGVPAAPPVFATPSSATFAGIGNFPPPTPTVVKKTTKKKAVKCKKGDTKNKKGKCVKKPKKKKNKAKKSASNDRRASR
jgi:hypothetical protein